MQSGYFSRADEVLARGIARHPDSPDVWFQRGVLQFTRRQFADAEASFRTALNKKPDFALAHFNLAHAREQQDDASGAVESLEAAVRFRPGYAPAHAHLGRLLLQRGERDAALEHVRRALRLDPENTVAQQLLKDAASP
jgi:tetratricopeptide (TPR) repeat protein